MAVPAAASARHRNPARPPAPLPYSHAHPPPATSPSQTTVPTTFLFHPTEPASPPSPPEDLYWLDLTGLKEQAVQSSTADESGPWLAVDGKLQSTGACAMTAYDSSATWLVSFGQSVRVAAVRLNNPGEQECSCGEGYTDGCCSSETVGVLRWAGLSQHMRALQPVT